MSSLVTVVSSVVDEFRLSDLPAGEQQNSQHQYLAESMRCHSGAETDPRSTSPDKQGLRRTATALWGPIVGATTHDQVTVVHYFVSPRTTGDVEEGFVLPSFSRRSRRTDGRSVGRSRPVRCQSFSRHRGRKRRFRSTDFIDVNVRFDPRSQAISSANLRRSHATSNRYE